MHWLGTFRRLWKKCGQTHTHTVLPHLQINSSFHYDLLNWTEDNIWASQVLKCWRKQRPLRPQSQHCIQTLFVNLVVLAGVPELIISHFDEMLFCSPWTSSPLTVYMFTVTTSTLISIFTRSLCSTYFSLFFFSLFLTSVHWSTITSTWNISLFWNFIGHTFPFRLCCLFCICIFSSPFPFYIVFMWAHLTYHFVCYQIQFV